MGARSGGSLRSRLRRARAPPRQRGVTRASRTLAELLRFLAVRSAPWGAPVAAPPAGPRHSPSSLLQARRRAMLGHRRKDPSLEERIGDAVFRLGFLQHISFQELPKRPRNGSRRPEIVVSKKGCGKRGRAAAPRQGA